MQRIAILASGAGSNAKNIIDYFDKNRMIEVVLIATNNEKAGVLEKAAATHIQTFLINKQNFGAASGFLGVLKELKVDFIILAGFLWRVPASLVAAYSGKILNIHPALLPKYGGKGMYGHHVHEAVWKNHEKESGITIHLVNEEYDEGTIYFQARVSLTEADTAEDIERKVRELEQIHFPVVIHRFIDEKSESQEKE